MKYKNTGRVNPHDLAQQQTQRKIAKEMQSIWADSLPLDRLPSLAYERKVQLNLIFEHMFSFDLRRWSEFVDLIASSEFLMEKVAQGKIDWAIELENCQMILRGDYPK